MNPEDQPKINDVKIIVTKVPFKCPICAGFGTLGYGKKVCHGCDGRGFVIISQEDTK